MEGYKPNRYPGESPQKREDIRKEYVKASSEQREELTQVEKESIKGVLGIVAEVDQEVLFQIFKEMYGKAGSDFDTLHLTLVSEIQCIYDKDSDNLGGYNPDAGVVLNAAALQGKSKQTVINTLVHEYVHEASALPEVERLYDVGDSVYKKSDKISILGVNRDTLTSDVHKETGQHSEVSDVVKFDFINEGLTQMVADEIHREYGRRTGMQVAFNEEKLTEQSEISCEAYPNEQFTALVYAAFLSICTGISEATIKDALVRTYFRNGKIVPEDIVLLVEGALLENDTSSATLFELFSDKIDEVDFVNFLTHTAEYFEPEQYYVFKKRVDALYAQLKKVYGSTKLVLE